MFPPEEKIDESTISTIELVKGKGDWTDRPTDRQTDRQTDTEKGNERVCEREREHRDRQRHIG